MAKEKTMIGVIRSIEGRRGDGITDDKVVRIAEIPGTQPGDAGYFLVMERSEYRNSERVVWEISTMTRRHHHAYTAQWLFPLDARTAEEYDAVEQRAFAAWRRVLEETDLSNHENRERHKEWERGMGYRDDLTEAAEVVKRGVEIGTEEMAEFVNRDNEERARAASARIRGDQ